MHGVSLLFVFLVLSAGIVAETTESLKIFDNNPTVKSVYTNSPTKNAQVNSLEGANNTTNTSSLEQKPEEISLRNITSGEYSVDSTDNSRSSSTNASSQDLKKSLSTTTASNHVSSGDVPLVVFQSSFTSFKSPVTPTDSENTTITNLISSLTTESMNRNDTFSEGGAFENAAVPVKDMPNTISTVPDTFNVRSTNETTERNVQPITIVSNITSTTNGTEETSPYNSTHSSSEIQNSDVPAGGNATDNITRTSNEYTMTRLDTNTMSENETISSLTKSSSTSVVSSEHSTLGDSIISLNATDNPVSPESTIVRTITLSSNTTGSITSDNPNNTVSSNYTDSTTEIAGNTNTSSEKVSTLTYPSPDNETPSMETTISTPQNSTFLKSTTSTATKTDTEVSDSPTDNTHSNVTTVSSTTDDLENTTYPLNTTAGNETTISNSFSSESTEYTATTDESSTSSYQTSEDLSSDASNSSTTDTNNTNSTDETTTVEVTTQTYPTSTVTSTVSVESSEDPTLPQSTSTVMTTTDISSESSTDETSSENTSTTETKTSDMPATSSTAYYTTRTTEIANHSTSITETTNTQSTTVTTQKISTTTDGVSDSTTNELGPPLNHFRVTDKNGVDCIVFSVRLELLVSYTIKSGAISDERIKVPIVDKFEGACGFADQYVSASWRVPIAGANNNISFTLVKAANNSSYTLKVIRVNMVLDKVNFPDAEHEGRTLYEEITPNFYHIPTGRGLKCATRKSYVGTNVTMIASDVELVAFNELLDLSTLKYGGCPLASAPPLQAEEIAAIAVGVVLALITASLATALVFRKRRTRNNKFYLTGNTWA